MGLRLRLFLVLIVPLTLVVGVYGLVRIRQEAKQLLDQEQAHVGILVRALRIAVENALRDRQLADVRRLLPEIAQSQEQIDRMRLFERGPRGSGFRVSAASRPEALEQPVPTEALDRVVASGQEESIFETRGEARHHVHLVPLRGRRGETRGVLEIVFVASTVDARVQQATHDVLLRVGVLTLVVALLTTVVLQRQMLRPLSRLTRSIRALGEGQPGPPLPVRRRDELGAVAEAFNRMAEQLEAARQQSQADAELRLELEQQLRQTATLAVAGKLTSGIAHEVGTPLNIISGRAEMLLRALPPDHPARPDLDVIVTQIDRISGIIRSLLDTVRMQKPEIQRVGLPALVDRLLPLLGPVARRRGVTLAAELPPDLPDLAADPGQLQQVLINLLMNALEATPRHGRVTVEAWACPASRWAWPTPARASRPRPWAASSSPSTPPSRRARARGSGWPSAGTSSGTTGAR